MKHIEVVVVRHPDDGTDVSVFVDGVEVEYGLASGTLITVIDPGAGSSAEDWQRKMQIDLLHGSSQSVREEIRRGYEMYEDSEFIEPSSSH